MKKVVVRSFFGWIRIQKVIFFLGLHLFSLELVLLIL